jgi:FHS family L-fucose permease-like MFS transporter
MIIPVMFFVMAYSYALAVNFVPSYRDPADKIGESDLGLTKGVERQDSIEEPNKLERESSLEKEIV